MVTEKRLDLGNISEIKLTGFANEFDARYEREFRIVHLGNTFYLKYWYCLTFYNDHLIFC